MNSIEIEKAIIHEMVKRALDRGWTVSVGDGEEWVVKRSRDIEIIIAATRSTDADNIRFRNDTGACIGTVYCVYGNGCDVICDHTMGEEMEKFMDEIHELSNKYQEDETRTVWADHDLDYPDSRIATLEAENKALRDRLAEHDGCSRYGIRDAIVLKTGKLPQKEVL